MENNMICNLIYRVLIPTDGDLGIVVFSKVSIWTICGPINHFGVTIAVKMNKSHTNVIRNQVKLRHVITT